MKIILPIVFALLGASSAFAFEERADTRTALPEEVAKNRKDWGTDLDVGTTLTRGNVEHNKVEANAGVFKNFSDWTAYAMGDLIHSSYKGEKFEHRGSATARLDYHLGPLETINPHWRIVAFSTYAFNEILKLNYRNTYGIGPWLDLDTPRVKNGISVLPVYTRQFYKGYAIESRWTLSFRYVFSVAVTDRASMGFDFFYVPTLSDFDDKRIYFSPYVEAFLWERILGLKLKSRTEYEGRPKGGIKKTDTEIVSSLTFHWGE